MALARRVATLSFALAAADRLAALTAVCLTLALASVTKRNDLFVVSLAARGPAVLAVVLLMLLMIAGLATASAPATTAAGFAFAAVMLVPLAAVITAATAAATAAAAVSSAAATTATATGATTTPAFAVMAVPFHSMNEVGQGLAVQAVLGCIFYPLTDAFLHLLHLGSLLLAARIPRRLGMDLLTEQKTRGHTGEHTDARTESVSLPHGLLLSSK
jgi:hypothetical protein